MLNIDWPTEWDCDFREMLRLRLETSLRTVMGKSRNSQLRGNVVVEDVFPGTISPQIRLKHIHSLQPSLLAFSIAVRYEGDAHISLSGLEINLDTTSGAGSSNRKGKSTGGSHNNKGGEGGGNHKGINNTNRAGPPNVGESKYRGGGEGEEHYPHRGGGDRSNPISDNNAISSSPRVDTASGASMMNDDDRMFSGDANHSLPFYCPFAMTLGNIIIEDTVDVQIITNEVEERPEYYFGKGASSSTTSTGPSPPPPFAASPLTATTTTSSSFYLDTPSPITSPPPHEENLPSHQTANNATTPSSAVPSSNKQPAAVMPLHVLVKSLQYSHHIDDIPEEYAHLLLGPRHNNSNNNTGGGTTGPVTLGGGGKRKNQLSGALSSQGGVDVKKEGCGGGDDDEAVAQEGKREGSSHNPSSSSSDDSTPRGGAHPLTTETLQKQQLLEEKKSDVAAASAAVRSAAVTIADTRMESISMARSNITGGGRTINVLYGLQNRKSGMRQGGVGGRQPPGNSNLYSVARRGMYNNNMLEGVTGGGGRRKTTGGGDKSSGSSGSMVQDPFAPIIRQSSWTTNGSPDFVASASTCSGSALLNTTNREEGKVGGRSAAPRRPPVAAMRVPREDEIKVGGALPARSVIRRGPTGDTSSGNSPPRSGSHTGGDALSRALTPTSRFAAAGGGSSTSKPLNSSLAWHRGGYGSSFAFAAGVPHLHAAGRQAQLETRQRDFLSSCLEPFAAYYPEGLSFIQPYWNLSAYNHITGAGSALDAVVSNTEKQCTSFADLFLFGRFSRVQKGATSRRSQLFGDNETGGQINSAHLSSSSTPTNASLHIPPPTGGGSNGGRGGTTIRLQFFSDPVRSFNVSSNFGSVHVRVNETIESTLRNLVQPAIDKLLVDGLEFTV